MSRGGQKSHSNPSKHTASLKARGLKDIRIDEEVKIAVNIALERFQYSDEKGLDPLYHRLISDFYCFYIFYCFKA